MNLGIIAAVVLLVATTVTARGEHELRNGTEPTVKERPEERDQRKREEACECCRNCMAAKKPVQGEEGPALKDGCKECCRRCGTENLPLNRKMPPEIVR